MTTQPEPATTRRTPREVARWVLEIEAAAIGGLVDQLDEGFDRAVEAITRGRGRVVTTGMGKSGQVMKKIAATLASTGTPAFFLHPAEAIHGDLGVIARDDVIVAASYSGTTEELLRLVEMVNRLGLGVTLIAITASAQSPLARHADIFLPVAIDREACPLQLAPTASTTATLALGDALAMAVLEQRGFTQEDFARLHPGGHLGRRLLQVEALMHRGEELPRVLATTPMLETLHEMSRKRLGITAVVDEHSRLIGCLSDGDLRRALEADHSLLERTVGDCMRTEPLTIAGDELAPVALKTMEAKKITSLFVVDDERALEGIVHLHDLWRLELF